MGKFDGRRFRIYLDEEAQEIRDEKLDHLKRNYDGPSDFVKQKLQEEQVLSIEEKIKKYESKLQEDKDRLEQLKQIKNEREEQSMLRDKRELLKEKQEKLKKLASKDRTRDQVRDEVEEKLLESKPPRFSDDEYLEKKSDRIERMVEQQLNSSTSVDDLVKDVERLQDEVAELNGGEEDYFLKLKSDEMGVVSLD